MEDKKSTKQTLMKWVKVVIGVLVIVLGLLSYYWWWGELWLVFKGVLGLFVALVGLVILLIGISD